MAVFKTNGVELYYEFRGEGAETVILLNGIMMNTRAWANQTEALSRHYRVLLNDFRGQGQSSKPDHPYTHAMHVADLKALLDHCGVKRAHFVGTSYGSEIAMAFAVAHPEYVHTLTVAAGVSHVDQLLRYKIEAWILAARHALTYGAKRDFYPLVLPLNYSSAFVEGKTAHFTAQGDYYSKQPDEWFQALIRLCDCFNELNITESLAKVQCPSLIVAGEHDELKPLHYSRTIASKIPNARLQIVEAGHALVIEKADAFNQLVLDFLRANPQ